MEQIRIIKEMREADAGRGRTGKFIRPRFMVWENVVGAFSSNKGADFAAVLHETIKIVCPQAPAVSIPKHGWPTAGCLTDMGGKWSLAWRVFDAQFWGVPQRLTAPEILFERQGVPGYSPPCGAPWQTFTADTPGGAGETSAYRIGAYYSAGMLSPNPQAGIVPADISCTLDCNGGAPRLSKAVFASSNGPLPYLWKITPRTAVSSCLRMAPSRPSAGKWEQGGGNVPLILQEGIAYG